MLEDDLSAEPAWSITRRQEHPQPQAEAPPAPLDHAKAAELIALLTHPMAVELLASVEQWIAREASGGDAAAELNQLRAAAKLMFVKPDA